MSEKSDSVAPQHPTLHMRFADGISNEKSKNNKHPSFDPNQFNFFKVANDGV